MCLPCTVFGHVCMHACILFCSSLWWCFRMREDGETMVKELFSSDFQHFPYQVLCLLLQLEQTIRCLICEEEDSALEMWRSKCLRVCGRKQGKKQKKMIGVVSRAGEKRICTPFLKKDIHMIEQWLSDTFPCIILKSKQCLNFQQKSLEMGELLCCNAQKKLSPCLTCGCLSGQYSLEVCVSKPWYKYKKNCIPPERRVLHYAAKLEIAGYFWLLPQ